MDNTLTQEVTKPKVLLIDDSLMIAGVVKECLPDMDVEHSPLIPVVDDGTYDADFLSSFDIMLVDGEGIGYGKYKNGIALLKDYVPSGINRLVVYFSANPPEADEEKMIREKGFVVYTKGWTTQSLREFLESFY